MYRYNTSAEKLYTRDRFALDFRFYFYDRIFRTTTSGRGGKKNFFFSHLLF